MNIAELFVNLGIKGGEKTISTLGGIRAKMGDLKSASLETKAGILGAVYAFERMISTSAQMGTNLSNFATLTGISSQTLERYQYAARQAGIASEEVTGSFKAVQNAMAGIARGEGAPAGMLFMAKTIGGIDFKKFRDIPYMMQQFQKFAQSSVSPDMKRWALGTAGISEGMQVAMEKNKFTPQIMNQAPVFSDKKNAALDHANIAMLNLEDKIKRGMSNFTAKHGSQIVGDISKITDSVFHLVGAMTALAESLKVFKVIGMAFEGLSLLLDPTRKDGLAGIAQYLDESVLGKTKVVDLMPQGDVGAGFSMGVGTGMMAPVTVNQNITHHGDAKDTKAVKDLHRLGAKQINNATRQRQQGQGS